MKRTLLVAALVAFVLGAFAETKTYAPTLDVNFRTAAGNTAWNSGFPKSAADEGNNDFELTYTAGLFALQKYTVADLKNASKLVLTLTVGSKSGVDAVRVWAFTKNDWTAETDVVDIAPLVAAQTGIELRATEGTANTPLVTGSKVKDSDPAKATFTISGAALATIKANASEDGTFTLLLTNNDLTNTGNKRGYLSNNSANDEANRPTLEATIETPSVVNTTTGVGYSTLEEAFAAAVSADADAVLEVSADQKLTARLTWNVAHSISIIPTKDITIKGPKNAMWFLANKNDGTMIIGSKDYKITLDGINDDRSTFNNSHVTRRENSTKLYLTNIEFKDFVCGANTLIGCKNAGGGIFLEDITLTNCTCTDAFISNLREQNDALYLKGFLNVENCEGTTIYTAKNRIRLGDPEGTSIYDGFSATNTITIAWGGEMVEGTNVIVKVPGAAADKFQLVGHDGWWLARKATNGDMYMTQKDDPATGISATLVNSEEIIVNSVYDLQGRQIVNGKSVNGKLQKGIYIVNGRKVIVK